ncbi:MAG: DMT family transporter [Lentisphaeria bacterium]|nr:DMT family transporter [Lentisphaeria bacterium]
MTHSLRTRGLLCGLAATLMWASVYPASRFLFGREAENFDEWFVAWLRNAVAVLFLFPFACRGENFASLKKSWKGDWKVFLLLAVCAAAEDLLLFISLKYTTAARASVMANTSPIFTVVLAFFITEEAVTGRKIAGMLLGFAGIVAVFLARGGDVFSTGASMFAGDLLALLSGAAWALFTVAGNGIAKKYDGLFTVAVMRILGIFLMIPVLLFFDSRASFGFPLLVWIGIVYLGCGPSGLAVGLWRQALKYLPAGELGAFGYISALSAVVISVIFLGEKVTWGFAAAAVLILSGVALMLRQAPEKDPGSGNS